ncbi:hypothetical protein PV11_02945 [Exophiala sideris]|uniref:Uncharacterized protein n=1 Tax=Exophiala sideris TaxID=1016849 RepID=A0A0D1XGT1_9EURO|nr:hypothetical protein PV11_02945 [Exophiala sideris]
MARRSFIDDVDETVYHRNVYDLAIGAPSHVRWVLIARQESYFAALVAEEAMRNHAAKPEMQQLLSDHFSPGYQAQSVLLLLQKLTRRDNWKCSLDWVPSDWNDEVLPIPQPASNKGIFIQFTCRDGVEGKGCWPNAWSYGRTITFDSECYDLDVEWDTGIRQLHDYVDDIEDIEDHHEEVFGTGSVSHHVINPSRKTLCHILLEKMCLIHLGAVKVVNPSFGKGAREERGPWDQYWDCDKLSVFIIAAFCTVRFPRLSFCGRDMEIRPRHEPAASHEALEAVKGRISAGADSMFSTRSSTNAFQLLWAENSSSSELRRLIGGHVRSM